MQERPIIGRIFSFMLLRLVPRQWTLENLWVRISPVRRLFLRMILKGRGLVDPGAPVAEKVELLDEFIKSIMVDPEAGSLFSRAERRMTADDADRAGAAEEGLGARIRLIMAGARGFMKPGREFRKKLRDYLMAFSRGSGSHDEERYFRISNLQEIEEQAPDTVRKSTGKDEPVFSEKGQKQLVKLFGKDGLSVPLPESYIEYFFPDFQPDFFIRKKAGFNFGYSRLFSPREVMRLTEEIPTLLRIRDRRNIVQRLLLFAKKWALVAFLCFFMGTLFFDLGMMAYGIFRNDYYYSFVNMSQTIGTMDTPFARRANRIYRMNNGADFGNFDVNGSEPAVGNIYRIGKSMQAAVELNYSSYRLLRTQDQNGLMVLALDEEALSQLRMRDRGAYARFIDLIIDKNIWERFLSFLQRVSGGDSLLDYGDIPIGRIKEDLTGTLMKSPAPLSLLEKINGRHGAVTLIYYKPNTRKWSHLDEIPDIMTEAVIIREDRRFRNDFFPMPHRGNDNLVIIPQIFKKTIRGFLEDMHKRSSRMGYARLEGLFSRYLKRLDGIFSEERRGGSSISNQVMEMLYTKYIPRRSVDQGFRQLQIEQKKHELPASLAVDWFWTEDNILESYANEVYGGHLYSDIRGFASQAEVYFMKSLKELNLREQMMLVAAVKKPSRIKQYARWLKAAELDALQSNRKKDADRADLARWERDNALYRVNRSNFREILRSDEKARIWLEKRTQGILRLLYRHNKISGDQYRLAAEKEKVRFNFSPGPIALDPRLAANIRRELDRELGQGRSDSGIVMVTTIDMAMQKKLQSVIDGTSQRVDVDDEDRTPGQPASVLVEGGGRIIQATEGEDTGRAVIVNRIVADVGGRSGTDERWDWVTQANRSLGSSLKPILDLYFLLEGYNLSDMLKNTRVTYETYTLEQRRIYQNFIHKYPDREKEISTIEKYWSWSPRNYRAYTEKWVTVHEALMRSVNSIHVQIQEIVTPETFARLLNEMMDIHDEVDMHRPYRSIILGGSSGDQRYDRFLLAYSIFPNEGIVKHHTYIDMIRLPDGSLLRPDFKPVESGLLAGQGEDRVRAACMIINSAMRDIVRHGTMHAMGGIGAGKTGTSNELRDALATVHFMARGNCYIAGVRLGNRDNYSIGRAADKLAVPVLRNVVRRAFEESELMQGDEYDRYCQGKMDGNREIVKMGEFYYLKGGRLKPRMLTVSGIQEERRKEFLSGAEGLFRARKYRLAAEFYEQYLALATAFDSRHQAFHNMVICYIKLKNLQRAGQLIERFSSPGKMMTVARFYEKEYGIEIDVNRDFYNRDDIIARIRENRPLTDERNRRERDGTEMGDRKERLIRYAETFVDEMKDGNNGEEVKGTGNGEGDSNDNGIPAQENSGDQKEILSNPEKQNQDNGDNHVPDKARERDIHIKSEGERKNESSKPDVADEKPL